MGEFYTPRSTEFRDLVIVSGGRFLHPPLGLEFRALHLGFEVERLGLY